MGVRVWCVYVCMCARGLCACVCARGSCVCVCLCMLTWVVTLCVQRIFVSCLSLFLSLSLLYLPSVLISLCLGVEGGPSLTLTDGK